MLQFEKLRLEGLNRLKEYFAKQTTHLSDFSLGFQFMWNDMLTPDYAIVANCLILREYYAGKCYFHYPLSLRNSEEDEDVALFAIEEYCREKDMRLHYTNVPKKSLFKVTLRYGDEVHIQNPRRWRDYLYLAESFRTYAGGKYAGQRNHVNQFCKNYPDWAFRVYQREDAPRLLAFLQEYEKLQGKTNYLAKAEMREVYALLPHLEEFGMVCGILSVAGKIVACAIGERCGDMLVVHVEKALRAYEGAYSMIAKQFALAFTGDEILYLNRMDDAGDMGLRKSKLNYSPCEIVDKYTVIPKRAIDSAMRLPTVKGERITLMPVKEEDGEAYRRLAGEIKRNEFWGYDYRVDYKGEGIPPAEWFLQGAKEDFHRRSEMPVGIYAEGNLVGEVTLHRFGYRREVEIGVRLLPEWEGKGYARESVRLYAQYAFLKLGVERVEAKCCRENIRSANALLGAGMREERGDEVYRRFFLTASN